jgi:hypothetical protein
MINSDTNCERKDLYRRKNWKEFRIIRYTEIGFVERMKQRMEKRKKKKDRQRPIIEFWKKHKPKLERRFKENVRAESNDT